MRVYVAHHRSRDIYGFEMDDKGSIRNTGITKVPGVAGPMVVNRARNILYVAVRTEPWTLVAYAIGTGTGVLAKLAESPLVANTCYLELDPQGRALLQASYQGSQIALSTVGSDGTVQDPPRQVVSTPPNAHAIVIDPTMRFAFVPCLGGDCMLQFCLDLSTGRIWPNSPPQVWSPSGSGPRHLRFHPSGRFAYLLHERDATLSVYSFDPASGRLTEIQHVATLAVSPGPRVWAADLQVSRDGRFLYTTERGTSNISIFEISRDTGLVAMAWHVRTESQPRAIAIHPQGEWLLSTGEMSSHMSIFRIDPRTGYLERHSRVDVGEGAHWIEMVEV